MASTLATGLHFELQARIGRDDDVELGHDSGITYGLDSGAVNRMPPMDSIPLLLALLLGGWLPLALVIAAAARAAGAGTAAALAQIAGRLDQLAQSQAAQQAALDASAAGPGAQPRQDAWRTGSATSTSGSATSCRRSSEKAGQSLTQLAARLAVIDRAQANIMELSGQVVGLQNILSNKQARGAFGEVQLNDLRARPAGARELRVPGQGRQRPGGLPAEAAPSARARSPSTPNFPWRAIGALREAGNETERIVARRAFDQALRKHVKDIREKYIVAGETAESALLFLPSEAVYAELYANFPNVVEESYRARVWIVSPTTMMALLNTVRAVLRDVEMRKEAGARSRSRSTACWRMSCG